jgi:3-hydroxy-9,10-secoandrosta-1,3,5(10)-triene-9,17-dione monooxygenase
MTNTVLGAVRPLLPAIAEDAPRTDDAGRVPPRIIQQLRETSAFRMLQPTRWGGLEAPPAQFFEVVRAVAAACASTGWVVSVMGVHPWQLALFDEQAQADVWGSGSDVLLSSSYAPIGDLSPTTGGYRLTGRWSFSSGCEYADWVLLGATSEDSEGRVRFVSVLVPMADATIRHVWDAMGLRGTASDDIVVEDVFVPVHRVLSNYDMVRLSTPGQQVNDGPLYRLPFAAVFTTGVTAPVQGAAIGCYREYMKVMRSRTRGSLGGGEFVDDPFGQVAIARAASEIDAGILQMDRNLTEMYDLAVQGSALPMELRLRTRRDQVRATERSVEAVDILFRLAGGMSLGRGNPIERAWRDAHAAAAHVANEADRTLALYGQGAFGLSVEDHLV